MNRMNMKKWVKKGLIYMLVMVMMVSSIPFTALADDDEDEIPIVYHNDSNNNVLRLVIGSTERVKIGRSASIGVTVKNVSGRDWKKTTLWIAPEEDYKEHYDDEAEASDSDAIKSMNRVYPFEFTDSLNKHRSIGSIKTGAQKTSNFRVTMKRDLAAGYYPVLIGATVEYEDGTTADFAKTMILWAEQPKAADDTEDDDDEYLNEAVAFMVGENQSTPEGSYGQVMNFGVNLRNIGYKTAYDVRVIMELSEDVNKFPFEINDGNYERWMNNMEAGASVSVPYSMAIRKDATTGYYPIKYTIRYREEENGNFAEAIEKIMYVRIYGQDDEELSADAGENERTKARIIVDSFETEPATILAGEDFVLKVRMKNASSQIAASNILFTFDPETVEQSPVFMTVNGSNSMVVNNLAPGATEELVMYYSSSPSAEQRSYSVTIKEQYDSPEYKNAEESVKIAIPIKQEARLNTGNIEIMPNSIEMGQESNIMFEINNTGKVTLFNVTAIFEADSIQRSENYVGNIKPGESGSVDAMILGLNPTMDDGMINLNITYEDENGTVNTVEKELQLFVTEPIPMEDPFMNDFEMVEPEPEPTLMDQLKQYAIPIGAAVVAIAAAIVFFVKKKKKKAGMEDEIF